MKPPSTNSRMDFALVNNERVKAEAGLNGLCPGCLQPVIAKCGTLRKHHWAHHNDKPCDSWYEGETEWHSSWKRKFPEKWQEAFLPDELTGEKHMADVRTDYGLVIEFQHSPIHPKERTARETFYKNMVWIVNGARLKKDYKRLLKGMDHFRRTSNKGIYLDSFPEECFHTAWLESLVPVIFDFRDVELTNDMKDLRNSLYCLFPKRVGRDAIIITISHDFFAEIALNGDWSKLMKNIGQFQRTGQHLIEMRQRQQENIFFASLRRPSRYKRGRRF